MGGSFGSGRNEYLTAYPFEEQVLVILKRPGMYVVPANYHTVTALIIGLEAYQYGLTGFHQWLVVRLDGFNNVAWEASVVELSDEAIPWPIETDEDHERAISLLHETMKAFFEYRHSKGLTKIYYDYAKWLLAQDWYDGPLRESE